MTEVDPAEAQLDVIFYYGAFPVWKFVERVFALDIREVCPRVAVDYPQLLTDQGCYRVELVGSDYCSSLFTHEQTDVASVGSGVDHQQHITFLLNCVNVVFNMLKEGIVRDGKHILGPYGFQLDARSNLELVLLASEEDLVNVCYARRLDLDTKLGVVHGELNEGEPDPCV